MAYIAYQHPVNLQPQNPLLSEKEKKEFQYTEDEWLYYSFLTSRIKGAQEARDTAHAEFGGKTYLQKYQEDEDIANTRLPSKKNKSEKPLSTGTVESKLNTLLSHINNLNLTPTVYAYDKDNRMLRDLGISFTDIMERTAEHDGGDDGGDKEKRMNRQRELLKHGTVFVQDSWITKYRMEKKLKEKYKGQFRNYGGYIKKFEKVFEGCSRDVLYGPNVYLGDITQFSMNDQPFVFTVETMSYDQAKMIYGSFENFQFVQKGNVASSVSNAVSPTGARTIYEQKFRLTSIAHDQVEIIKYQSYPDNEFAIIINGVLLTPIGFPLSAVTPDGNYNIAKQHLYVINPQFAYGKSFVSSGSLYELSLVLDNFLSLFELKTRKSITPPYINISNRVIPARVLDPGNISMNIPPNALQSIGQEGQGVTASEYQIFKEIQDEIEKSTVSAIFQGQQAKSGATATEIMEVQRQAKLTLGLIISACTLLEIKCAYIRLFTIIGHWLEPTEDGSYRRISKRTRIDNAGVGERMVIPIDELPSPKAIRQLSLQDEQKYNMPVRRYYINPKQVQEAKILWYIVVEPKEEETSSYQTIKFREMIGDALSIVQLGAQPNIDGVIDEFGKVHNVDTNKIFTKTASKNNNAIDAGRIIGDRAAGNNINQANVPT